MTKISWRKRFDEIGFGNQARIVGVKRVELKDFIDQELKRERKRIRKGLNTLTKDVKSHNLKGLVIEYRDLDNYLKEREGK